MKTRFDLEQEILDCWGVCDDIDAIYSSLYEESPIDNDRFANLMLGLKELYSIKFQRTFATFEELIQHGELN